MSEQEHDYSIYEGASEEVINQLKQLNAGLDEEYGYWKNANLPHPSNLFQFGSMQFTFNCEHKTVIKLLKEKFGLTQAELDLVFKQVVLEEMQTLRRIAKDARSQMIRQQIVDGVGIVKPKLDL